MTGPSHLKARVLGAARATPSPSRPATQKASWLLLPAGAAVAAALYLAMDGVRHGRRDDPRVYATCVSAWAAVAALSMQAALSRGDSPVGRSRASLLAVAAGTPAALYALSFLFTLRWPALGHPASAPVGFRCLGLTFAAAALPLLALSYLRRGSDPVHPRASGAALGAGCGASAGIMVEMWCPYASMPHVTLGHVVPVVVCALVGFAICGHVIGMRR